MFSSHNPTYQEAKENRPHIHQALKETMQKLQILQANKQSILNKPEEHKEELENQGIIRINGLIAQYKWQEKVLNIELSQLNCVIRTFESSGSSYQFEEIVEKELLGEDVEKAEE